MKFVFLIAAILLGCPISQSFAYTTVEYAKNIDTYACRQKMDIQYSEETHVCYFVPSVTVGGDFSTQSKRKNFIYKIFKNKCSDITVLSDKVFIDHKNGKTLRRVGVHCN